MNGLKRVGSELLGTAYGNAFPSLKVLAFKDMKGWEEWSSVNGGVNDGSTALFPCPSRISIINCSKLGVLEIDPIYSLRFLHVERCSAVVLRSIIGVSSSTITRLTLKDVNGLGTQLDGEILECLMAVEYLSISCCDELKYLWRSEEEACKILVNLQWLEVAGCKNLVSLGDKKVDFVIRMESLRSVRLGACERLESYHCGSDSIENLRINKCDSVTSLTFPPVVDDHDLSSALKSLGIWGSKNVEVNWLLSNFLSSLTTLHLSTIPDLRLLPEGCLLHLTDLIISKCENIESIPEKGYGFLPHLCLSSLTIHDCKNTKSFPHEQLPSLTSLRYMHIEDCPSMDNCFPCGLWPPNLGFLVIGGLKKPMSEWGIQNFPNSLETLHLCGQNSGVISFANAKDSSINTTSVSSCPFLLPSSLTCLRINNFKELKTVSKGMEHLTSLEELDIENCRKLRDLPETLLPCLLSLTVDYYVSRELRRKCTNYKNIIRGKYWHVISEIPCLVTD